MSNVQVYNIKRLIDSPSLSWSKDIDGNISATTSGVSGVYLPLAGGVMTGVLTLEASAAGLKDSTGSTGVNGDILSINGSGNPAWTAPAAGGVPSGSAIASFPCQQPSTLGSGWQGFSVITMVRAGALLCFPSSIKITLSVGGVGTMNFTGAVVYGCAKGDLTRTITVKSAAVTWGGVSNPSLSLGDNQSDALAQALDNAHDWYFVAHVNSSNTNTTLFGYNTNNYTGIAFAGLAGGDVNGDQTGLSVGGMIPAVTGTQTAITSINAA